MNYSLTQFKENILEIREFRDEISIFDDRWHAGEILAKVLSKILVDEPKLITLAIPAGGVPIGIQIAKSLNTPLDLIIVRKMPIPTDPEAGFGALAPDGTMFLNKTLLEFINLADNEIELIKEKVLEIIKRRNILFRRNRKYPDLKNTTIILTDDGLASGYTMRAAIHWAKKHNPKKVIVAVPTSPINTALEISTMVNLVVVLNLRESFYFAVADAYKKWYDISDEEIILMLNEFGYYKKEE
ncbi:MAG: phosphoribosyltransferase [Candidatus Asgardarchaeia archaeon]